MPALLICSQLLTLTALALGLGLPKLRSWIALVLLALTGILGQQSLSMEGSRTLEVSTSFVAYVGNQIQARDFAIETVTADKAQWLWVTMGFTGFWGLLLLALRKRRCHPFWWPFLLAVSTEALVLAWECSAAPAALVQPGGLERGLFVATALATVTLAHRIRRARLTLAWLALFITGARLPVAIASSWLTQNRLGTSLDIHSVTAFANPLLMMPVEVEPGSAEQAAWLIWGPHLLVLPALFMLSLGGLGFAIAMYFKQQVADASQRSGTR